MLRFRCRNAYARRRIDGHREDQGSRALTGRERPDTAAPTPVPRVSIGLPVYNGERYLSATIDSVLAQEFTDFELIISDNASTDSTEDICRQYAASDRRIRYVRQAHNLGSAGNHNFVAEQARGDLFKWASHDDLYARDLLRRCVDALDDHPDVVLAHSWTALVGGATSEIARPLKYLLTTNRGDAPDRFRSTLFDNGGDDAYGVIRADVLRRVLPYGSYYRADRTIVAAMALHGPFHQVPDWLYFRREHANRASRTLTVRSWCTTMDPRRADRLRHPTGRLLIEYVWGYVTAIRRAPLSPPDRRKCYHHLVEWMASRSRPRRLRRTEVPPPETVPQPSKLVDSLVPGRRRRPS